MLSIIVSWRDRNELERALPNMLAAIDSLGGELIVVNFSGCPSKLQGTIGPYGNDVRVVTVLGQKYFNKAAAQNVGGAHAKFPILFFCDCDIVLPPEQVERLAQHLMNNPGTFATFAGVRESETNSRGAKHVVMFGYELRIHTADGRKLRIVDNEEDGLNGTRQAPGLLFVRRDDFKHIGGYNSDLHGWGWEDQDMISRLTLGQDLTRITDGYAIHISHDDHARIAHYPEVSSRWESRDRMFRKALSNYDNANFQGSYEADVTSLAQFITTEPLAVAAPVGAS